MFMVSRYVLLAIGLPLTFGTQLRGLLDAPNPPPLVDPVKYNLQIDTAGKKIAALKVKSVFAANSAKAAASQARTAKLQLEEIYVKTMAVMPELQTIKADAKKQAAEANAASKATVKTLKQMEKDVKPVIEDAKRLAVAGVKTLLKEKYHELDEWRHKVLANPWEKGQVAAAKAAVPYFNMMGAYGASQVAYGLESGAMKAQAASAAENAKSLADGVKGKKDAGDVIGSAQDNELAKALEIQSEQLSSRAASLDGALDSMGKVVPIYADHARSAAWNAEYAANPDGLPPPPTDPNFAFTPPPPQLPR